MTNMAIVLDRIAIPFWVILIIYAIYELSLGISRAWIILIIIGAALILDLISVIKNRKNKEITYLL